MMSDHWKKLANLLGTPGPAEPPESETSADENQPPEAESMGRPPAQPSVAPPGARRPAQPRKRSSMWGDDSDREATSPDESRSADPQPAEAKQETTAPPAASRALVADAGIVGNPHRQDQEASPPVDALVEIVAVKREPPVPGFDLPEGDSPERRQSPPKRSAWDTLIGTLGIKPAPEPEVAQRPTAAPPAPEQELPKRQESPRREVQKEVREPRESSGFGAGLIETQQQPRELGSVSGAAQAGYADVDRPRGAERTSDADAEHGGPRARGRRGGTRNRGRDTQREADPARSSDIGWEPEPPVGDSPRRPAADQASGDRPRRAEDRPTGARPPAGDAGDSEGEARRRRPRRRGQRQTLSAPDADSLRPARQSPGSRADSDASLRGDLSDRDDTKDRDRGSREARSEEPRSRRTARPPRQEDVRRGEPRGRRADADAIPMSDEDVSEGFGGDLLAESSVPASGEDDVRSRPRRRRGRRGRGMAGPRGEDNLPSDEAVDQDDTWAPVSEAPEFDDDYEDDDEAEQIRRRSRGGRSRSTRRDTGERSDPPRSAVEQPPRSGGREEVRKQHSAPTWLDTVNLLVDANIQRRAGNGGSGSPRGSQGGRSGRR